MACASNANKMANNSVVKRVNKSGNLNGISRQSTQKTRNLESKLLLCGVTELKRGLCGLNVSKRSLNDICE